MTSRQSAMTYIKADCRMPFIVNGFARSHESY